MPVMLSLIAVLILGCGESGFRQEVFTKTRPLGTETIPVTITGGASNASIILHMVTSAEESLSFLQTSLSYASNGQGESTKEISAQAAFTRRQEYQGLEHHEGLVTFEAPTLELIAQDSAGRHMLAYAFVITNGSEQLSINGNITIYPSSDIAATYQKHEVAILKPSQSAVVNSKNDLIGQVAKSQQEDLRITWLVPNGKVVNRRDLSTFWEPDASGNSTIVLTVRGKKSQSLSLAFLDVTME